MKQPMAGPRDRYRAQIREEVQQRAWEQIEQAGVTALSLKAIATAMGMTAPALYRYFAGRDELLTDLILQAYEDLAVVVETAAGAIRPPQRQLHAIATALRNWALANPQRYLLIYGTPVPGYTAPPEATALAQRIFAPVMAAFQALDEHHGTGGTPEVPLSSHSRVDADGSAFNRTVFLWTRLHGVLSLELAGHFVGMNLDTGSIYDHEARAAIS